MPPHRWISSVFRRETDWKIEKRLCWAIQHYRTNDRLRVCFRLTGTDAEDVGGCKSIWRNCIGVPVNIVTPKGLRERYRARVLADARPYESPGRSAPAHAGSDPAIMEHLGGLDKKRLLSDKVNKSGCAEFDRYR